ncbi:MAG TPA: hypothetical protein DD491_09830 [Halieaceae bacterium]|nr:hypothetical protein [Halieaceae bacterium]
MIPDGLSDVITDSGRSASSAYGNKPIFTIDVAQLTDGQLDPTGLLLGNDAIYEIAGGALFIAGGTLEMAPGAVIAGGSQFEYLVISQGARIDAEGTAEQPIIFTASADVEGTVEDNDRGLWGGLVINGFAPINDCPEGETGGTEGCTKEGEANSGTFGGADPEDDSGILKYVNVRYSGSNVDPENQLNGIAFQGVGSGTVVEYVQVHNALDDGIEWFGGTVNGKYLAVTGAADDSLDWTDGWTGAIQYVYVEQTDSGDNVIEADNREGDENLEPRSNPAIANMSAFGAPSERALRLRRGTGLALSNSLITGSDRCLRIDGTSRDLLGAELTFAGVTFDCATMHDEDTDGAVEAYLASATNVSQNGGSVEAVTPADPRLEPTTFVGAFGATDWSAGWTTPGTINNTEQPDFGCPGGTTDAGETIDGLRVCDIEGTVTSDLTLTANNLYQLNGKVTIGDDANPATLNIQAGTTVFGGTSFDFLVIAQGSKIEALGSRTAPVTLTARADVEGTADIATDRGLWGGLVINGRAPINDCPEGATGGTEACTKQGEADSGLFGGADPADDSGTLNYVVVKYAGSNVDPENQLNGIAFQGVGSGTEISHIQVHNNLDDGVEFFGGTANAKYVVLTGNADDSLDWTDGWTGSLQYVVIDQADDAGDNGIEADNREGDENLEPRSLPRIANMTINGNPAERGIRLRRGTGLELYNSVVQGSDSCLRVQGESLNQLGSGIIFDGVTLDCATVNEGDDVAAVQSFLDSSNVAEGASAPAAADLSGDAFFDATGFVGAVEDPANDWTSGWTVGMPDGNVSFGCPAGTGDLGTIGGKQACQLSGTIAGTLTLTRDNNYVLDGKVLVGDEGAPATLNIESGTTIIGSNAEDFMVISRGSQLFAMGTEMAPITFTSLSDVNGVAGPSTRGEWGGLVINGFAPINDCPAGIEGGTAACTKEGEANSGLFGGDNPADSSGELHYVVVKYAGSNVDPENQLNGIAFQGVGSGTVVEYIQVHNNLDDGVEFFGGTVDAKYVVLTGHADDSLDWTDGWTGRLQYVYIEQTDTGDNGIEADNREGDELVTPVSMPSIANMTIVARNDQRAVRLRRGTGLMLFNSQLLNGDTCLRVQGESENLLGTGIVFDGVQLDCTTNNEGDNVQAVQDFLDSSNVSEGASLPPAGTLPADGFFEQNSTIGADVDSWKGTWTFGI